MSQIHNNSIASLRRRAVARTIRAVLVIAAIAAANLANKADVSWLTVPFLRFVESASDLQIVGFTMSILIIGATTLFVLIRSITRGDQRP